MKAPSIVNITGILKAWMRKDTRHLYIGRKTWCASGSKWQNPYRVKVYGTEESLRLYEAHVRHTPSLWNSLHELEGKILGCWCKPRGCHGDVLIRLLEERKV